MSTLRRHKSPNASGFTLIEIMVVVVIVLLMIGLALPVFRTITGARSEEGAANNVSAMLGRAHADAVGLQKPIGVAFVYNPITQLSYMAEVTFSPITPFVSGTQYASGQCVSYSNGAQYYFIATTGTTPMSLTPTQTVQGNLQPVFGPPLDMVTDTELVKLPTGVAAQTICDYGMSSGTQNGRPHDGYLSVGVILFDSKGRLVSMPYGIANASTLVSASGLNPPTATVLLNSFRNPYAFPAVAGVVTSPGAAFPQFGVMSQFGIVLFQREAFAAQNFNADDTIYNVPNTPDQSALNAAYTTGSPSQQVEELWIDQNSTPLLIDRYTGELIKAE